MKRTLLELGAGVALVQVDEFNSFVEYHSRPIFDSDGRILEPERYCRIDLGSPRELTTFIEALLAKP